MLLAIGGHVLIFSLLIFVLLIFDLAHHRLDSSWERLISSLPRPRAGFAAI
jgi:hypothetical protein